MQCSFDTARNYLIAAGALLASAAVSAALAIAALVFVWTWWLAPLFIGLAALFIAIAALLVGLARAAALLFYNCMTSDFDPGPDTACWGNWSNFSNSMIALVATLGILAATAGAMAGSFLGWWSAPDMWVLYGGLITNGITILIMLGFLNAFIACITSQP